MPTFYVSDLDSTQTLGAAGAFAGNTIADSSTTTATTLTGTATLATVQAAFRFYTIPTTDGGDTTNFTGAPKAATDCAQAGDSLTSAKTEMIGLLAGAVFGSSEAGDLFSNNAVITNAVATAMTACLAEVNDTTTNSTASDQMINAMLATTPARFELAYNAVVSSGTAGTHLACDVQITAGSTDATAKVTVELSDTNTVLRITSTVDATTAFAVGSAVTIIDGGGSGVDVTISSINSVQAAMLNGTLDASAAPTNAPLESGDILRVLYIINSNASQTDASGDAITVKFEAHQDFTM